MAHTEPPRAGASTAPVQPAPTRPRLQAVNQDFSDLDQQLRHVAHIIGLPQHWASIHAQEARHAALQPLARPRAEWVLRWLLDKLKHDNDAGRTARSNATAWLLLDCMFHALPVSRSAPHLRDASFPTILERSLLENFGDHRHSPAAMTIAQDASEPTVTASPADAQPSRKRKRGTLEPSLPKRAATTASDPESLFAAIKRVLRSIADMGAIAGNGLDVTQAELIKMVLRTDSAQAGRILNLWFTTVSWIWVTTAPPRDPDIFHLSLVNDIWDMRIIDSSDETASSSQVFSDECLISTLLLSELLRITRLQETLPTHIKSLDTAAQILDKLLTRHLLAPARAAFFAAQAPTAAVKPNAILSAAALANYLQPLQTKILHATQIQDAGDAIPTHLESLFCVVPQLLDLAIRVSPSKTPKARLSEKGWIQAVFISLAECLGFSVKGPPESSISALASTTLEHSLCVLRSHQVSVDPETLQALFWCHCGVENPEIGVADIRWPLIAALVELDPAFFVTEFKSKLSVPSSDRQNDLAQVLFQRISATEIKGNGFLKSPGSNIGNQKHPSTIATVPFGQQTNKQLVVNRIVLPLLSAFARNRNLLGFLRHWDDQLTFIYKQQQQQEEELSKKTPESIWESRALKSALQGSFEQSLTQSQIAELLQDHADRMINLRHAMSMHKPEDVNLLKQAAYHKAASSAVIIPAILQSIHSDDNISALKSQLQSLLLSYTELVQDVRYSTCTGADVCWFTLCQLATMLWPLELHASAHLQETWLLPLIEKATYDMAVRNSNHISSCEEYASHGVAMLFLLDACDRLSTVPGFKSTVQSSLVKIVETLSSGSFHPIEHKRIIELFSSHFVLLLSHLNPESTQKSFIELLYVLSKCEEATRNHLSSLLSRTVFEQGDSILQNAYLLALSEVLHSTADTSLDEIAVDAFLNIHSSAIARDKREIILDQFTKSLIRAPPNAAVILSAMDRLMEVPNASAALSTNGNIIFEIADHLHGRKLETPSILQQLHHLVKKILEHIVPNRDQPQSQSFFKAYTTKLGATVKDAKACSPARLAILRATIVAQKDAQLLNVKQYARLLKQCLGDDYTDAQGTVCLQEALDAFNEIPELYFQQAEFFNDCQSWLKSWIKANADLDAYLTINSQTPAEVAEYVGRLHTTVAKFKIYPTARWFVDLTLKVVREPLPDHLKRKAYTTLTKTVTSLEIREKLDLVTALMDAHAPGDRRVTSLRILNHVVSTLPDKLSGDTVVRQTQLALLPRLCILLAEVSDDACFNALLDCVNAIINEKPSLTTQYGVESVLAVLAKLTSRTSPPLCPKHASDTFQRLCETGRLILLVHRSRLGGRCHLVLPLLQNLLFCLFTPISGRSGALPGWLRNGSTNEAVRLTSQNAAQYTRLVSTLCNPPQSTISKSHQHSRKRKDLVDPVKVAREKASQFLYPLLGSFCRFQLAGRLDAAVRKKLMPGIWELIGTASLQKVGLEAMFAGMGRSEKDVWRSLWGEWEGIHGRREKFWNGEEI